jgi:CRP/FNR family cyclic AMP-dependent transcriptional regulator
LIPTRPQDLQHVLAAFESSELLHVLSPPRRRALAQQGEAVQWPAGEAVFAEGQPAEILFVVIEGQLETRRHAPGGSARPTILRPGTLIDELASVAGAMRSSTLVAVRRSRLWRLPRLAVIEALQHEPQTAGALIAELSGHLAQAHQALEAYARLDLGGRLARLLIAEQNTRGLIGLTQTEIAARLNASRERVNRKLHDWVGRGWVELTRSGVRLRAAEELRDIVRTGLGA